MLTHRLDAVLPGSGDYHPTVKFWLFLFAYGESLISTGTFAAIANSLYGVLLT